MSKRLLVLLMYCIAGFVSLSAQNVILLNDSWEFQRLEKSLKTTAIKNQGSDWESQFNIEHVEVNNQDLTIPSDTLRLEFSQLRAGEWHKVNLPHTPFIEPLVVLRQ